MRIITGLRRYQEEAAKTIKPNTPAIYYAIGLTCEATEILQPFKKQVYHDKPADMNAIAEELGDCLWYIAAICTEHGWSLEDIATENIAKLRERHGESYNGDFYTHE